MFVDSKIIVSCTSRLYADEISKLQEKIGAVVPLIDSHANQNLHSMGLSPTTHTDITSDYVLMFNYLSKCTLAVLEEVNADSLVLTKIQKNQAYQIKNIYQPFFHWDNNMQLCVIPPLFGKESNTVALESNNFTLLLPSVVPTEIAHEALQKFLTFHTYSRVIRAEPAAAAFENVVAATNYINYMGATYFLNVEHSEASGALAILDNLSLYLAIMVAMIPRACVRLITAVMRQGENELLGVLRNIVPEEFNAFNLNIDNIEEEMSRLGVMMTYLQTLSSIFNLGPKLQLSSYISENLVATCWISS
ncbi:capsid triplex subunit 2 [Bovine gammaherpesvirus 6]|uniref:Capsid triplex subunit 2 n=1 Tax=Bovine gammaherpesvirus 6 TaxID=1504288 RepID=A0A060CY15_9GAMA|nr:capsid triplex subunit 2 [Bovine gammaherpesvirus 6]AIB03181.1 capsid triplex subunit 2 [Bovine gammaherpesvirus 6]